jgi:hypothetical protein
MVVAAAVFLRLPLPAARCGDVHTRIDASLL